MNSIPKDLLSVMFCKACKPNDNLTLFFLFLFFFGLPNVELHVCVVYLLRISKSEYSCFLSMQLGFGCKTMDIELLFSCFNCTFCEFHSLIFLFISESEEAFFNKTTENVATVSVFQSFWSLICHSICTQYTKVQVGLYIFNSQLVYMHVKT